jgi:hypothetical protein
MSDTKIVIDKEQILDIIKSQSINHANMLFQIKKIISEATEIQIDQSIEEQTKDLFDMYFVKNNYRDAYILRGDNFQLLISDISKLATSQQIIERLRVKEKELYEEIKVKEQNPNNWGWYKTDKGLLYYFPDLNEWSCNDSKVSEEYPKVWYKRTK